MTTKIFVNLPVKDLKRSSAFYSALGYRLNQQFSDEKAASFAISDDIYVMLLVEPFFKTFTPRPVADGRSVTEVITALTADSKDEVNRIMEAALAAGAVEAGPTRDETSMYSRSLQDPDGHIWEYFWMDPGALPPTE